MQAILKSEHQRFYNWFCETISKQRISDRDIDELGAELQNKYTIYEQKVNELRQLIIQYEETKQRVKNKIKLNLKYKQGII